MEILNKNLENILLLGVKIGIFLILLTPLVIVQFTVFPTLLPKAIYFRILVGIVLLFYVLLLLSNHKYLPKISPILISLFIFIEVLALSIWKSINPWRSFWGTMERMDGFITSLYLFAFFLILVGVFQQKKDWLNLLRFTVLVSIPVGIAGILQKLGIFYFFTNPADPRISATLGNSVLYGNYLTLVIFLAIFLGVFEEKRKLKILFWAITIFNSFLLFLTGTRGAWIGMILAGGFLSLCWFLFFSKGKEKKRQAFLFGIFIILLFFLLFLLFSKMGYLPRTFLLERYERLWIDLLEARSSRFAVWKLGLDAWRDSPLFGYGSELFSYIYDKYYRANLLDVIPETLFFDRAHNKIIDILVANGIVGLLSYLAVFGTCLFVILRNYKKQFTPLEQSIVIEASPSLNPLPGFTLFSSLVLIAFFLDYFIQNIFAFDTISSYLVLFLVFGFIDVNFRPTRNDADSKPKEENQWLARLKNLHLPAIFYGKIIIAFLVFFFITIAIFVNIRFLLANIKLAQAHHLMDSGEYQKAFESLKEALKGPSYTRFETYYYAAETIFFALPLPQYQDLKKEFSNELQKITKPLENHLEGKTEIFQMRSYLLLARIYKTIYLIERDPKYLEDEERILGKAIKFNPQFPAIYRLAGNIRFLQNRKEEGMVLFTKAYELDKNLASFYEWLGMSFVEIDAKAEGAEALRRSLKNGDFYTKAKFNLTIIWKLVEIYEESGDYQKMAAFYEEVILLYPGNKPDPQLYASLSTVYAKIGDKERARQTTLKMLELYPEFRQQAQQFLSTLENEKE